ncbi:Gep7p [Saccharomyces eubayanus]|uniref:Gep7p n=1 Tax=Saccharomyces eubayanus TaxID=1080349 RepID=UPI0006C4E932|nr:GEP7-like protein [Saccharomyces eubayanus]KOG99456.1 GEP7-like protein [Saccharomyces eubayanus]
MMSPAARNLLARRLYHPNLKRAPPTSLLLKQKIRLAQNTNNASNESPISFSHTMSEVFSVLQPNAPDPDEDKTIGLERELLLTERLKNDELSGIINKHFHPSSTNNNRLIDTDVLLQNFPKLNESDLELLNFAIDEKPQKDWHDLQHDFIQLWYTKSFGFLGPRSQFIETNSPSPLKSQFLQLPLFEYNWLLLQNKKDINLSLTDLKKLIKIYRLDDKKFTWKSIDPFSKVIISLVICVSVFVWFDESAKQKNEKPSAENTIVVSV